MAVSVFRHPRVWYTYMRLGEAADEFLYSVLDAAGPKVSRTKVMDVLRETVGKWNNEAIQQRTQMLRYIATDIEEALHTSFSVFVKDVYAEALRCKKRVVRARMPRVTDFVHSFFMRLVQTAEVRRGSYFEDVTLYRNHAVSNAMLSALSDMCVDNVRVKHHGDESVEQSVADADGEDMSSDDAPSQSFAQNTEATHNTAGANPGNATSDDILGDSGPSQIAPTRSAAAVASQPTPSAPMQTFRPPVTRLRTNTDVRASGQPATENQRNDVQDEFEDEEDEGNDGSSELREEGSETGSAEPQRRTLTNTQGGALRLLERLTEN